MKPGTIRVDGKDTVIGEVDDDYAVALATATAVKETDKYPLGNFDVDMRQLSSAEIEIGGPGRSRNSTNVDLAPK
jgi:hypothetical protein